MEPNKPFIQVATVCEKVLVEPDGVASLIRIIDTMTVVRPRNMPAGATNGFPISVFIRLGSDTFAAKGQMIVQARRPDQTLGGKTIADIEFRGDGAGAQIRTEFLVLNPQDGVYWFDVSWEGERLTSFPLRIKLVEEPDPQQLETKPTDRS